MSLLRILFCGNCLILTFEKYTSSPFWDSGGFFGFFSFCCIYGHNYIKKKKIQPNDQKTLPPNHSTERTKQTHFPPTHSHPSIHFSLEEIRITFLNGDVKICFLVLKCKQVYIAFFFFLQQQNQAKAYISMYNTQYGKK